MMDIKDDTLIYDIECSTEGKPDPNRDKLKVFGCYSYKHKRHFFLTKLDDIKKMIKQHKYLVGFNTLKYDNVVLMNCGLSDIMSKDQYGVATFQYKINIDMIDIFKKRAPGMKIKKGMLGDLLMKYSLDFISKTIGIVNEEEGKIKDFDYSVLNKPLWTPEEKKYIIDYTKRDLEVTRKMYEWLEEYFDSFRDFQNDKDVESKKYLTSSTAVYTYKVLCKELGVEEEYTNEKGKPFGGGYVAWPAGEKFEGNILLFDFSSLYPNLFIMGNLFANECDCCTQDEKWHGDGFFEVEGYYCSKKMSKLGEVLKKFYLMRLEMKKNKDPREYSIKIVINTSYGCVANPAFKHVHNAVAAADCTSLGQQFIKYARKRFKEEGYKNLMSDTDSIAVQIPEGKNKEDAQVLADKITEELLAHMPFPW